MKLISAWSVCWCCHWTGFVSWRKRSVELPYHWWKGWSLLLNFYAWNAYVFWKMSCLDVKILWEGLWCIVVQLVGLMNDKSCYCGWGLGWRWWRRLNCWYECEFLIVCGIFGFWCIGEGRWRDTDGVGGGWLFIGTRMNVCIFGLVSTIWSTWLSSDRRRYKPKRGILILSLRTWTSFL